MHPGCAIQRKQKNKKQANTRIYYIYVYEHIYVYMYIYTYVLRVGGLGEKTPVKRGGLKLRSKPRYVCVCAQEQATKTDACT